MSQNKSRQYCVTLVIILIFPRKQQKAIAQGFISALTEGQATRSRKPGSRGVRQLLT